MDKRTDKIYIYADWAGMQKPKYMGILSSHPAQGAPVYSFEYSDEWLQSSERFFFDPDINWYSGAQFPANKNNFGIIFDSMPDSWGKMLIRRFHSKKTGSANKSRAQLQDVDYLLAVNDFLRSGGLRFKTDPEGPFVSGDSGFSVPPWAFVRELQASAKNVEEGRDESPEKNWLGMLIVPGSSLGGARPKANIQDEEGNLWIAKFPSLNDIIDTGGWEQLINKLAVKAGITVPGSNAEIVSGKHHTYFTKRFDRLRERRIHFSSAMTVTGYTEEMIREKRPSYLEMAEFLRYHGAETIADLKQLWRRIAFNIAVSNTDDHLRNHGFLLEKKGWRLSPAYDLNPSIEKPGLALNIDLYNNDLDFDLAMQTGEFYELSLPEMKSIIKEVLAAVKNWRKIAVRTGLPKVQIEIMSGAFKE